jgi:aerobic carbon-monoxide dehydrogenase large subunit
MHATMTTGIGAHLTRLEDGRFLVGRGQYTDDIVRPGQLHAQFVRSPHAHARIMHIETKAALEVPGAVAVFSGADLAADKVGSLPCVWGVVGKNGVPMKEPPYPPLAIDTVRHVGDAVALVLAETKNAAKDTVEALKVTYQELPAVTSPMAALRKGAPQLHPEAPGNLCNDWELGDKAAAEAGIAKAAHITRLSIVNQRLVANAIEPRSALAEYDPSNGSYTLYTTSQNPHFIRFLMCTFVLHLPEHKVRVVAPDVGGGFGSKIFLYAEEAVVTWAAKKVGRPVKWTAERAESFTTDRQCRDHVTEAVLALGRDGKFLALKVSTVSNVGAYLSLFAGPVQTLLFGTLMAGQYTTPAIYVEGKSVFTNTTPVDAYRGAGRPEATYVLERIVEQAARELGIDPLELRRRNLIPADKFPYDSPMGVTYDTGNFQAHLNRAVDFGEVKDFVARKAESAKRGKLRGIGFSSYIEACGMAPSAAAGSLGGRIGLYEAAEVRFDPTGTATVFTGCHSHGQGHETAFAQIASDKLGLPIEKVEVVYGDTARIPFGLGTHGSRSLAVGGSAIVKAIDKLIAKGKKIAAHMMEASDEDVVFEDGQFKVAGTDRATPIEQVAFAAYVPLQYPLDKLEPGFDENAFYDPTNFTFPSGTYVAEVEVDPETGMVEIVRFTGVDDFGNVINPLIVEGQVHGGVTQGIGQALVEHCIYNAGGQLVTGSYMDYVMPRADQLPNYQTGFTNSPCTHNPLGAKGCGEAGAIGAPPAVINALLDALAALGVATLDMPATPNRVWQAIQAARNAKAAAE